jgi:DNA-directed RNA polymerase specialized sigma54-like protein
MEKESDDRLITKLQGKLETLPEKPPTSKKSIVEKLRPVIRQARERGYSYEEIAIMLAEEGFEIKPRTLKAYCGSSGTKKATAQSNAPNGAMPTFALPLTA